MQLINQLYTPLIIVMFVEGRPTLPGNPHGGTRLVVVEQHYEVAPTLNVMFSTTTERKIVGLQCVVEPMTCSVLMSSLVDRLFATVPLMTFDFGL